MRKIKAIKTAFATITLTSFDAKEAFEVPTYRHFPDTFFHMSNAKGDGISIALRIENHAELPAGYQYEDLADIVISAIEIMRDDINTAVHQAVGEETDHLESELLIYNFNSHRSHPGSPNASDPADDRKAHVLQVLRQMLNFKGKAESTVRYSQVGWSVTGENALFRINADGVLAKFIAKPAGGFKKDVDKYFGVTGILDGAEGVLDVFIPRLDGEASGMFPTARRNVTLKLVEGFWGDLLKELKAGVEAYNKLPHLPMHLRTDGLSAINPDQMVKNNPDQCFDLLSLNNWLQGRMQ